MKRFCRSVAAMFGLCGALAVAGCDGDNEQASRSPDGSVFLEKAGGDDQVGGTGRDLPEPIAVRVYDTQGDGIQGFEVDFSVTAGGGTVSPASAVTDAAGEASVRWRLGAPPVRNRVTASAGGRVVEFVAWADPGDPPAVDVLLPGGGLDFANEDLAFAEGRGLFLGSPGAILNLAAPGVAPVGIELAGETIESPTGIAFGASGDLYVCENAPPRQSVKRVRPSGLCETLSAGFEGRPFALPNYIAVHSSGEIYLSSTCDNRIYRISPVDGETSEFLSIPGPNGIAFDAGEAYLYILTENPRVFCTTGPDIPGGLFRVPLGPEGGPGDIEPLVERFALAGDGLAFDEEGNLYVVFSGYIEGRRERLFDSGVFVRTPEGSFGEFFTVSILEGEIITNIAFGVEPFDPLSLYCYGFTGRLYRVGVGIRGRPIP